MFAKYLSVGLVFFLISASAPDVLQAQTPKDIQKVASKISSFKVRGKETLSVTMRDRTRLKGRLIGFNDSSFLLTDQRTGKDVSIAYSDVKSVSSSKHGLSTLAKIGIGVGIGIGILLAVCIRGDQGCGYG